MLHSVPLLELTTVSPRVRSVSRGDATFNPFSIRSAKEAAELLELTSSLTPTLFPVWQTKINFIPNPFVNKIEQHFGEEFESAQF